MRPTLHRINTVTEYVKEQKQMTQIDENPRSELELLPDYVDAGTLARLGGELLDLASVTVAVVPQERINELHVSPSNTVLTQLASLVGSGRALKFRFDQGDNLVIDAVLYTRDM